VHSCSTHQSLEVSFVVYDWNSEVPSCHELYQKVCLVLLLCAQKPKINCLSYLSSRWKTFLQDGLTVLIIRSYNFRLAFAGMIVNFFCKSAEHFWK
jgi:hypothetical protein